MAFSIHEFKAKGLVEGGARPSLFQVWITFPPVPATIGFPEGVNKASFMCTASQLPASIVEEVRVPYFGRVVKYKGDRQFMDWNITVLNDEDWAVRDIFESWQNNMNYLESNIMDEGFRFNQYKMDCEIHQFAKDGEPNIGGAGTPEGGTIIRSYLMVGAWPVQLSPINVSWGAQNEIETFDVTMAYDYWLPAGGQRNSTAMTSF